MHDSTDNSRLARAAGGTSTAERLCFDKSEFMKANFSVDEFLHKNRNVSSLELLRDNLGLYLKGLRASMIDLINEDYADFVSLSANLVGLDQSIVTIQHPLEQFRDDIESIHSLIEENVSEIRSQLAQKQQLRELKRNLQSLKKVYQTIEKLGDLLTRKLNGEQPMEAIDLERASLDLIQLKFNEKYCSTYLSKEQVTQIEHLDSEVQRKLRIFFNESLKGASSVSSEQLERCLRIYITLGACDAAERVFREDVVAPYMSGVISEQQLQNSPQGLAGIYSKILNFISLHMTDILRLTQYSDKLRGFNFVVNSYWADVETRLELHMSSIFAPGNSEIFYTKYKCTRDFMSKIEELLSSGGNDESKREFRQHKQTKSFQARWNLPVYFQICFQEIAGQFEGKLSPLLCEDILDKNTKGDKFSLLPFNAADKAIERCWAEGVYLAEVFPKFYKLNTQIILRLSRWINDVLQYLNTNSNKQKEKNNKTQIFIALHSDIRKFENTLPALQQQILKIVPQDKHNAILNDAVNRSFADISDMLNGHLSHIQDALVQLLIAESGAENVRQVNDLPRLYRKTNRDVPTRCSGYVEQMLRPVKLFATQYENQLGVLVVEQILGQVFNIITQDYYQVVSEVLTSVQKTEESLRRLRNLKGSSAPTQSSSGISDDDKIRLQLRVDVIAWTDELAKLNFMPEQIAKLVELNVMVEETTKLKERD